MRKAARLRMATGDSLAARCRLLATMGFEGLDVATPSDVDVGELSAAAAAAGIEVANVLAARSLHAMLADADPDVRLDGRRGLEISLRDAATLGASSVLLPALLPPGQSEAEGAALTRQELERVLPLAEELDVRVAIESCPGGYVPSAEELATFVDSFWSKSVTVHFDVGNAQALGSPVEWIELLGPRIHKVDLKEFSRARAAAGTVEDGLGVELGDGDCDWPAVIAALNGIGYTGWVSAELTRSGNELLARTSAAMDVILA